MLLEQVIKKKWLSIWNKIANEVYGRITSSNLHQAEQPDILYSEDKIGYPEKENAAVQMCLNFTEVCDNLLVGKCPTLKMEMLRKELRKREKTNDCVIAYVLWMQNRGKEVRKFRFSYWMEFFRSSVVTDGVWLE